MASTVWYSWTSKEDFDVWHNQVIESLNLPRIGYNSATGEANPTAQQTTAYTEAVKIAVDDWRAPVERKIADIFADGLGQLCEAPSLPDGLFVD